MGQHSLVQSHSFQEFHNYSFLSLKSFVSLAVTLGTKNTQKIWYVFCPLQQSLQTGIKYFLHRQSVTYRKSFIVFCLKKNFSEPDFTDETAAVVCLHIYKISCTITYYFVKITKQSSNIFFYFFTHQFYKTHSERSIWGLYLHYNFP